MGIHPTDLISTSPIFYAKDNPLRERLTDPTKIQEHKQTIIGNDVWIGVDALIMDGIRIGNGAIIGAKALVVKDVPAYAIVGGIPAHIIRYRFDENTIKLLEETQWWSLPISTLKTKVELFNKESFTKEDLQTLLK
ncbi:MAG: CatB-related O-acetyltransferase [Bacteroidales bacterium]|nr:CatB-related O-acetyltransferase [Bacteroidales bacterium]